MLAWQRQIAINSFKAVLPFQRQLRKIKRRFIPERLTQHHDLVCQGILEQIAAIEKQGQPVEGATVIELGSGWHPIAPLLFRAAGAAKVFLTDQHHLLQSDAITASLDFVRKRSSQIAEALNLSESLVRERLTPPGADGVEAMLAELSFTYLVPFDAQKIEGLVDIVYSHTVLEHIPPDVLETIFSQMKDVLREGGVFSSGIDNSDHRKLYDQSLSHVDFLRYSDRRWKLYCINPQDYTNRLRHSDYISMLQRSGFDIVHEKTYVPETCIESVHRIDLAKNFDERPVRDLCATWSLILASPARPATAHDGEMGTLPRTHVIPESDDHDS